MTEEMTVEKMEKVVPPYCRFLLKLRGINHVVRWNFHPRSRDENVAEHSHWVTQITFLLALSMGYDRKEAAYIAMGAVIHDAEEAVTGDLPALVKRRTSNWNEVVDAAVYEMDPEGLIWSEMENPDGLKSIIVKAADFFAAYLYTQEECTRGNTYFTRIRRELIGQLQFLAEKHGHLVASGDEGAPTFKDVMGEFARGLGFSLSEGLPTNHEISHL